MEGLGVSTIFTLSVFGITVPITETVIISWVVMLVLILGSLALTRRLKEVPSGPQVFLEAGIEFLNKFAAKQFGRFAQYLAPYIGSLFLFLLLSNFIGVLSPSHLTLFGREFTPPFYIRPPTKDINVTASLALVSVLLTLVCGFAARGTRGWFKNLLHPVPIMLPFNILEYGTRILSLSLRLFGNILGGFVVMHLIIGVIPIAVPMVFALYFDFFDGFIQAVVFVFLTSLYISEAVTIHGD